MQDDRNSSRSWSRRRYLQTTATTGLAAVAGRFGTGTARAEPGDVRWQYSTAKGFEQSSPTVVDETVYIHSEGDKLHAVDVTSGRRQWLTELGGFISEPVTVVDGTVYAARHELRAIDARLGSTQWTFDLDPSHNSSPVVANGTVFVGSEDGHLYAVDAGTGENVWQFETGYHDWSSPAVLDGTVYVKAWTQSADGGGHLYAVDAHTGAKQWRIGIDQDDEGAPTVSNGTVYVGPSHPDHALSALDSTTGDEKWVFEASVIDDPTPTVANGTVYVRNGVVDDAVSLYAVDAETGEEEWAFETPSHLEGGPTVADGTVFFGTYDGVVYAVAADSGDEVWRFEADNQIFECSLLVVDGVVYVPSVGPLYALEAGVDGSSEGSRAWLGTDGHHDEWAHADQGIQIHREGTYSQSIGLKIGLEELGLLGGSGLAAGGIFGVRQFFKTRVSPDRSDTTTETDADDQGA